MEYFAICNKIYASFRQTSLPEISLLRSAALYGLLRVESETELSVTRNKTNKN